MTRKELKNIKNAWAKSMGYDSYTEVVDKLEMDPGATDSLLLFSLNNSHKYVK